jgi:RNA polymerase sigma-70 factor (ECF subfamily)
MDRELVERARTGDHAAFTALAEASADRLYAVATLILRDPDRAQDAVQDALVLAWRDVRALRDPGAWDGWLHRIVVRACYTESRRQRRQQRIVQSIAWLPTAVDDSSSVIADRDEIERGFRRLTVEERAVLVLHFHADLSGRDVALALGVSELAARSRVHRAIQSLRAALKADARTSLLNSRRHA